MTATLVLPGGDLLAWDPATGRGVRLTRPERAQARRRWAETVSRDVDLLAGGLWYPHLHDLFARTGARTAKRLLSSNRRALAPLHRETRRADDTANGLAGRIADDVFDGDRFAADWVDVTDLLVEATQTTATSALRSRLGVAFDVEPPPAVLDRLRTRTLKLSGPVTDETKARLVDVLAQGIEDGAGIPDMARAVGGLFDDMSRTRATTIARTETISAYNGSARGFADSLPDDVVAGMEWIATMDDRTRPEHAAADGQIVGRGEAFQVGGEAVMYPGDGSPENAINCRCTTAAVVPEDMPKRSAHMASADHAVLTLIAVSLGRRHPLDAVLELRGPTMGGLDAAA